MFLNSTLLLITKPSVQLIIFSFLIILNIVLLKSFFQLKKKLTFFLQGKNAKNLEGTINNLIDDVTTLDVNIEKIFKEQDKQSKMLSLAIKKIGIVRFNPFNNTGGDQSFAIAFLDSKNSGIVISSLFLREGTRIYAKPINNSKSQYPLSEEEKEAIKKTNN